MHQNITGLSAVEASLLVAFAGDGRTIFTVDDALRHWRGHPKTASRLHELESKGWLERLERGKYLIVPFEAGPERLWTEDAFVLASFLIQPAAAAYWSALHRWSLTEQVPRVTFVQSTSRKSPPEKVILGIRFRFVRVVPRKFFGLHREHVEHHSYAITDREKTLIDCLDRPDLAGGIPVVSQALLEHDSLDWSRLDHYLDRFPSGAVLKRLGFLVETMQVPIPGGSRRLERWRAQLTTGISKLDPSDSREPWRIETRWGIGVNTDETALPVIS